MKKLISLFVIAMSLSIATVNAKEMKIGYIDFERAFNEYHKTKAENASLKKLMEEKEKKGQTIVDEINKLKAEMEILSEEGKKQAEGELKNKLRDLRDYTEDSKKELVEKRNAIYQVISQELKVEIEKIGKEQGYDFIIDDKALFYKTSAFDVTDAVLKAINN